MILPEERILACAAVLNVGCQHKDRLRRLMSCPVDGDRLIAMAVKEGLAGVLYRGLEKAGVLETLSGEHRARLQSLYYLTAASNLTLIHELKGVLERINREAIPVVLLQGVDLLRDGYADPGLRPTTDIDLWALPEDYPRVAAVLRRHGYAGDPLNPTTFTRGLTSFDLHTRLFWADRIRVLERLAPREEEEIFQNTRSVTFDGHAVRALGPYDQVIYLILHLLKHGVERLIWLVDITGLVSRWGADDWDGFLKRVGDLEQERAVSLVFSLLTHLFGYQPATPVLRLLERQEPHLLEKAILRRRVPGRPLPAWAYLILLSSGKAWRTRLLFILESLFPRPEILRQSFPDLSEDGRWVLYRKRVLQICGALVGNGAAGG
jgi:Uncharacterised nucleotidyltransferase